MVSGPLIEDIVLFLVLASRSFPWSALLIHITASDMWLFLVLKLPEVCCFLFFLPVARPIVDPFLLSVIAGLLAFLLIVLEWTQPSLPSPLRPICDLRVLNHFIKEAQDAEAAMVRETSMHDI